MRIHQYLSKTGIFSKKEKARDAIKKGEIRIGQKTIFSEQYMFDEKKERVYYKDNPLKIKNKVLIAMNKPKNYVCAKLSLQEKKLKKKSIYELLPENMQHLSCIGRLDEDSEGLLLMTNDGDFLQKIINKNTKIEKKYVVTTKKELTQEDIDKLSQGTIIILEENGKKTNYKTKPCKIKKINKNEIEMTLLEGKKRQIRRMIKSVNNDVKKLKRIQIGKYFLDEKKLKKGKYEEIEKENIN